MKRVEKWKWVLIILVFVLMVLTSLPSAGLIKDEKVAKFFPGEVNLGLDLQGGTHVVFEADLDDLRQKYAERNQELKKSDIEDAMARAMEILTNRIDKFGVTEPLIQRQGDNRIVLELAGAKDPEHVAEVVGRTAYLEFKLVSDVDPSEYLDEKGELLENKSLPQHLQLRYERDEENNRRIPYLLVKDQVVPGSTLTDAFVSTQNAQYVVGFRLNAAGARDFARITRENIKGRLAILLDDTVVSAPRINSEIPSGEGIIEGGFTPQTARDLALILKTGALPVKLDVAEERTVGASLGRDSIRAGIKAILWGFIAVIIFMMIYYGLSGVVADIALIFNLIIILGVLVLFNATLTLPGLAGIILTIGMSVDANVLIFERIREELKSNKSIGKAVEYGFSKAFITILDANITTIITAVVLYNFGTGPIKGFAVTLMIGILASMFTALFVSRVIFQTVLARKNVTRLSI
ncbi:MAG TPA: protein translocase subunit SecD [Firmicutes bacterium]|nr:protein translocase subunit SecD [Bacillota bacterium]